MPILQGFSSTTSTEAVIIIVEVHIFYKVWKIKWKSDYFQGVRSF